MRPLFFDCQTTGSSPENAYILEISWAGLQGKPHSAICKLPDGEAVPKQIERLTGITTAKTQTGVPMDELLKGLVTEGKEAEFMVAHFAKFEQRFLQAACAQRGLSFDQTVICTHEIARRLLPDLPSKGLRALSGYFGSHTEEMKRAGSHVKATRIVWNHLLPKLTKEGITSLSDLQTWLRETPAPKRQGKKVALSADLRLDLSTKPGVYYFLGRQQEVLYVGKATNLKSRVNSHFRGRRNVSSRHAELITQVQSIRVHECATDIEAALFESDEIKSLRPPYNVALKKIRKGPIFYARNLDTYQVAKPDSEHRLGPFSSPQALADLFLILAAVESNTFVQGLFYTLEDEKVFLDGLALFRDWMETNRLPAHPRSLLCCGILQIRNQSDDEEDPLGEEVEGEEIEEVWTPELVFAKLVSRLRHCAHTYLRARELRLLQNAHVFWKTNEKRKKRYLHLSRRQVLRSESVAAVRVAGLCMDFPKEEPAWSQEDYDRMSVLFGELTRKASSGKEVRVIYGLAGLKAPLMDCRF